MDPSLKHITLEITAYVLILLGVWIGGDLAKRFITHQPRGERTVTITVNPNNLTRVLVGKLLRFLLGSIVFTAGAILLFTHDQI
ncbi:hypothetical protein [Puniceicoccus vermicola]|uniref:Uncharacterized protein n=1 Tax=Puniceicoccus vermicola TaxID=388746 RepID=A0A7X1E4V7_9BACT|nr:hypothetical protein [Puniceicoccus vermicola]MBC2602418.1 hypothetical protein [Puniceicoccus vermicola]